MNEKNTDIQEDSNILIDKPIGYFDISRMEKSLSSGEITIPPGLTREEKRKFICDSVKNNQN